MTLPLHAALTFIVFILAVLCTTTSARQFSTQPTTDRIAITGDRLSGFVLPIEPITGDITLSALKAERWTVDDTKRLLLTGDVLVEIGGYAFNAERATVWINRLPSQNGLINQIAVYFDHVQNPRDRAGLGASGDDLLVTGSARGDVVLNVGLLKSSNRSDVRFVRQGEDRLAKHLRGILADPPRLENHPQLQRRADVETQRFRPVPGGTPEVPRVEGPEYVELPAARQEAGQLPLFEPDGSVRFSGDRIELDTGAIENIITITGGLTVDYRAADQSQEWSRLTLTAERAVIFTDPGTVEEMAQRQLSADQIRGIYLEGQVIVQADEGRYIVRAPRAYYDFTTGKAIMLDAVLRTYLREARVPIYARADEMRQIAANQWTGRKVRVSASEFATPHLAIGADRMMITQRPASDGGDELYAESSNNTLRLGDIPVMYWPKFSGVVERPALRNLRVGTRDNDGVRVETGWDLYHLLGVSKPEGVDATLKADVFTNRGAAGGLVFDYDTADADGQVDLYLLHDSGTDRTSSGREVDPDQTWRGVALLEYQRRLDRNWLVQTQASYISDETFITTWREGDFDDRREYETSLYFKRQEDRAALTFLGKYALNDFISNSYLLASRGYQVDKAPEAAFRLIGQSWFDDTVTYSGDISVSRMRLVLESGTPRELGVPPTAFGPMVDLDDDLSDLLRSRGLSSQWVNRVDSRHEISRPMQFGAVKAVPFLVGRVTAYDESFDDFSSETDPDDVRFFGAAGVRLSTRFQRVHNGVENRLFDLHRLRHIVEPSMTLWYGYASIDQTDLPVYDEEVESLASGAAVRFGLRNTWQTQRGGPGRWRSVDVFKIDTNVVFNGDDSDRESPTPQFFDYRPEYSQFGDHVHVTTTWLASDFLSILGEATYDLDMSELARGSIGAELTHSPLLSTWIEYRFIEASDNRLLGAGWSYRLSQKYRLYFRQQYDLEQSEFRAIDVRVRRSFPDFDFIVQVRHDEIRNDTSIGASVEVKEF